jgi:GAF domain-containing protein/HAMP domain-containing protein
VLNPSAPTPRPAESQILRRPAAARAAWLLFGSTLIVAGFYAFLAWQLQAWQMAVLAGIIVAFAGLMVVSLVLIRGHRITLAGWLMLGGMMAIFSAANFLVGDLGVVLGLSLLLLTVAIGSQTLPQGGVARALLLSAVIGAAIMLADLFLPLAYQLDVPVLQTFIPGITAVLVAIFAVFIVREFRNYSLRAKLIVSFVTVALLSVALTGGVLEGSLRLLLVDDIGANLSSLANLAAQSIVVAIDHEGDLLRTISNDPVLLETVDVANGSAPLSEAQIRVLDERWRAQSAAGLLTDPQFMAVLESKPAVKLREFQNTFPYHVEMFLTDRQGVNLAATNLTTDYYQADEEWWQVAFAGGFYIGQPELDESSQKVGLIMALAVVDETGAVAGILRTTLDQTVLIEPLARSQIGQTGRAHVLLPNGLELKYEHDAAGTPNLILEEVDFDMQAVTQSAETLKEVVHDAVPSVLVLAPVTSNTDETGAVGKLNWRVAVFQEASEALQLARDTTRIARLVALIVLVVASLLALGVAQVLARPIVQLTATAAKVSGGDLTAQAPVQSNDEIGALAMTFNVMTTQLRETQEALEQRVADRTKALRTTIEVSRRISTTLNRQMLAQQVVNQLQSAFDYYHAHIYFFDDARQSLLMTGGTGEAGRLMLERGHKLARGRGLVGRAAETNQVILVPDTAADANWLPNPLLPETQAEVAVPIALGDRVLGVLDVQQNRVNGLTEEDAELLQALAGQIAIVLQNAQSFERTQQQADLEAQLNAIGQQIQSATTVEAALQIAVRELGRALGGARTRVRLMPETNGHSGTAVAQNGK